MHPICVECHRQLIDVDTAAKGYSDETKAQCLKMDVNGMEFRPKFWVSPFLNIRSIIQQRPLLNAAVGELRSPTSWQSEKLRYSHPMQFLHITH